MEKKDINLIYKRNIKINVKKNEKNTEDHKKKNSYFTCVLLSFIFTKEILKSLFANFRWNKFITLRILTRKDVALQDNFVTN